MTNEHDPRDSLAAGEGTQTGKDPDDLQDDRPAQMWVNIGLFSLFAVAASGCFLSMFFR